MTSTTADDLLMSPRPLVASGRVRRPRSVAAQTRRAPRYAIRGATIVTGAGATIDKGTIVMRDGVIEDVGATVTAPADAIVDRRHGAHGVSRA